MGLFDALNAKVVAAIDRRAGQSAQVGVALVDRLLSLTLANGRVVSAPWASLRRVVALRRDLYAGDQVSLLLEFQDPPQVIEIASSVPGWTALSQAVESLEGSRPFGAWHAEALVAPEQEAIPVWAREGARD